MNTELKEKRKKNDFKKIFFKLLNNPVFDKNMENVRKDIDIKTCNNRKKRNDLVSEPNYHTIIIYYLLLAIQLKKHRY